MAEDTAEQQAPQDEAPAQTPAANANSVESIPPGELEQASAGLNGTSGGQDVPQETNVAAAATPDARPQEQEQEAAIS